MTGPRPHTWITGPDPVRHAQYGAFLRARAQARFRGESWQLTFEDFERTWQGRWHLRGRGPDRLCMARLDPDQAWTVPNIELITRSEHCRRHNVLTGSRWRAGYRRKEDR